MSLITCWLEFKLQIIVKIFIILLTLKLISGECNMLEYISSVIFSSRVWLPLLFVCSLVCHDVIQLVLVN